MQLNPIKYKVCVISALYEPYERGGAEKIARLVAEGLLREGHKVFVVTSKPWKGIPSLFPQISETNNVKTYKFYPLNIFSFAFINCRPFVLRLIWRIFDTFNIHSLLVLWYILKREQPDIAWTQNLTGLGLLTPTLLKILKIPHIHTLHDISLIEPSGLIIKGKERKNFLIRFVFSELTKRLFGSPRLVVSPSKWLLNFYSEHGFFQNSKALVKQNPIPFSIIPPRRIGGEDRVESNGILQLLYIGQLEKHKGILFLIFELDDLVKKYKFQLSIVGIGKLLPYLEKIARTRNWLTLCGKLDGVDMEKIWGKIHITIVPSLAYENSPTVIYESLSRGVPVIASRIGGIPELVEDNKNGFLFEAGDKENLKNILIKIFKNRQILNDLHQNALAFEVNSPDIYAKEVLTAMPIY